MQRVWFAGFLVLLSGCGDLTSNLFSVLGTSITPTLSLSVSGKIAVTAITNTTISLAWTQATGTGPLTYQVYRSAANPAYGSFATLSNVQAGTLVGSGTDIGSLALIAGATFSSYYFNVIVSDAYGNQLLYDPFGEYFGANLTLYYPFDGNLNDVSPSGNTGTFVAAPTSAPDRFGHANSSYSFSQASSQWLHTSANIGITGAGGRTVSFWMKAAQSTGYTQMIPVGYGSDVAFSTFGMYLDPATFTVKLWCYTAPCDVDTGSAVTTNWEHWVITYNGANIVSYKNGTLVSNTARALTTTNNFLSIGNGPVGSATDNTRFFDGSIDDVRLYNSPLSAPAVSLLYTVTQP